MARIQHHGGGPQGSPVGRTSPSYFRRGDVGMARSLGERQGAKPAARLCGLLPGVPGLEVRDSSQPLHAHAGALLQGGAPQLQPQLCCASSGFCYYVRGVPGGSTSLEPLAPPVQSRHVVLEQRWSQEAPKGGGLHAPTEVGALQPLHQEPDAIIEPGVAEWVVLPLEQSRPPPEVHEDDCERVPREMALGGACGGPEEVVASPRWPGHPEAGGCHRGHGGRRLPQAERPPICVVGAAPMGDDARGVLGQDADAGGASARRGDFSLALTVSVTGSDKELLECPNAPR